MSSDQTSDAIQLESRVDAQIALMLDAIQSDTQTATISMADIVSGEPEIVLPPTISMADIVSGEPEIVPPPTISMADILAATEVVLKKEDEDRAALNGIATIPFDILKGALIRWAAAGFPNAYMIHEVPISVPDVCSDGVVRSIGDYITYVSGKTIQEHVAALQTRILDFTVSFTFSGTAIVIVVSKN